MGVLGTLSNPSQVKPSPSPISVKFETAPIKKASTKKPPIKRPLIKKNPKWPPKKASIIKMTIFEILFEQEFYDLTLLLYKYFIRGGGGLENI